MEINWFSHSSSFNLFHRSLDKRNQMYSMYRMWQRNFHFLQNCGLVWGSRVVALRKRLCQRLVLAGFAVPFHRSHHYDMWCHEQRVFSVEAYFGYDQSIVTVFLQVSNAQHTNIFPAPADGSMFSSGSSPQRVLVWSIKSYYSKGKFHTMTLLRVRQLEKQCLTLYARSNGSVFQLWIVYFLRTTMSLKQHIQSVISDRESFIQSLENIIIDCKVWFQQDGAKAHTSEVVI